MYCGYTLETVSILTFKCLVTLICTFFFLKKSGNSLFVVINIMPQMLSVELNLYWTQNIFFQKHHYTW